MGKIKIALLGNPNCGKTTLFNTLTGAKQHVGNWSGVTVEKIEGKFKYKGYEFEIVDLPGIYSLEPNSIEEIVSRNYIVEEEPDVIINIVDGTTLERSLYLTSQLMELETNIFMAINMYDEVEKKGIKIDLKKLATFLNNEVTPIIAKNKKGVNELLDAIIEKSQKGIKKEINRNLVYNKDIEKSIKKITEILGKNNELDKKYSLRWLSITLLKNDEKILEIISKLEKGNEIKKDVDIEKERLKKILGEDASNIITEEKYGFAMGLTRECVKTKKIDFTKIDFTEKVDNIILNKWLGLPIFAAILWLTFTLTFNVGAYFSDFIESGVSGIASIVDNLMNAGILKDLIVDGIIGGVGGILVFLPQIVLLFLMIAILEDSGYMARVAFIMDRAMHFLGLHGKAFISLFMGFGCNVPGIMAARSLENEEDRIVTALVNPFMSCSARLPVYILIAGVFFKKNAGNVIFSIYTLGIIVAIVTAKLLKTFFFKSESVPFVMELPPYRTPTAKSLLIHMWDRASMFLKKMGGVILVGSILIWVLGYFPTNVKYSENIQKQEIEILQLENNEEKAKLIEKLENSKKLEKVEKSYIGQIGHVIEPVFRPLGMGWREAVALGTGIVAKEVVVSTISVLYGSGGETGEGLAKKMKDNGMNKAVGYALMVFVLLYVPCVATIAAIRRETNSLKWTIFSVSYGILVAYIFSFIAYRVGSLFL